MSDEVEGKGQKEAKVHLGASRGGLAEVAKECKRQEANLLCSVCVKVFEMITMSRFLLKRKAGKG